MAWTEANIGDQSGRVAIVTGANSGLGLVTARMLARHGATVIVACRNERKGAEAVASILNAAPGSRVSLEALDLASSGSIRAFAQRMRELERLDLLINNAGVMALPRTLTADGFEMQFGTNHLGHFALTGLLIERILATRDSRIVTLSSGLHRYGRLQFDDLMGERRYDKWRAYATSKLANLLFAYELDRRLRRAGSGTKSLAAHPGYAATNLAYVGPELENAKLSRALVSLGGKLLAQSAEMGALPTLRAATDPAAESGSYYGPSGFQELRGDPVVVGSSRRARNETDAAELWARSEQLTGVRFNAL